MVGTRRSEHECGAIHVFVHAVDGRGDAALETVAARGARHVARGRYRLARLENTLVDVNCLAMCSAYKTGKIFYIFLQIICIYQ